MTPTRTHTYTTGPLAHLAPFIARAGDGWGIGLRVDDVFNVPCPNPRWCHIPAGEAS